MEDQDLFIYPCNDRVGDWFSFASVSNDWDANLRLAIAKVSRASVSGAISSYAAMFQGGTTKNGDCGFGIHLNVDTKFYDLSPYANGSIRFWYKTSGIPVFVPQYLRLELLLANTVAVAKGGNCMVDCNEHYYVALAPANDWTEAKVPLNSDAFSRSVNGDSAIDFDLTHTMGVQFVVRQDYARILSGFSVTVDDIVLALPE
jgi:hypothetical protein